MHITGTCHALFAYDLGYAVNLDTSAERITELRRRSKIQHRKRAPDAAGDRPEPLVISQEDLPIKLGIASTNGIVQATLHDFGAVCLSYAIPLNCELEQLIELSDALYGNVALLDDSRKRARQLLNSLQDAVEKPCLSDIVEDYAIFELHSAEGKAPISEIWSTQRDTLARILRGESGPLSAQEVSDAVSRHFSFGVDDVAFVDWFAAVLFGNDMEDERSLLELVTVELLELRLLDWQLDLGLEAAYESISRRQRHWLASFLPLTRDLTRIGKMQADNAMLFEGVTNAYKLLGDQYLARLYREVSKRFHLDEWDASITRKLHSLQSIYQQLSDQAANRRIELLEWIIIILIAVEIIAAFFPKLFA